MSIPNSLLSKVLQIGDIKYVPVSAVRAYLDRETLESLSDWFFGKPGIVGLHNEFGIPIKDLEKFFSIR